jgi:acetyl-CoA carboxylase biotin carboxylase subunit
MLKAAAGGGGRGMRMAASDEDLVRAYPIAQAEAQATFGNGDIYVERLILKAKHIEVQVVADRYGNVVHLGERDCSLQRRQQKLLEEAPCATLSPAQRQQLCAAAVQGTTHARYESVGTMEFLLDPKGTFYFLEMNTRLQVEHPVTEMITGIDLAKLQIRIAQGEPLPFTQDEVVSRGHAIECRLVAEDPEHDFAPQHAPIRSFRAPGGPGVRTDSHLYPGYEPPPYYDSLLAKIITWGADRAEAIARMERVLRETEISGPITNIGYHLAVLRDTTFRAGRAHTQWALRAELAGDEPAAGG